MAQLPLLVATLGCTALLVLGCSSSLGTYQCQNNADCVSEGQSGGTCQANDLCSFADSACGVDGQRYGGESGELSDQCVGATPDAGMALGADATRPPPDADRPDGPPDIPCTAGPTIIEVPGTSQYELPQGCSTLTVEAFGAGGGGARRSSTYDSGAGGGGGSGLQLASGSVLIAAAGGGGGSSDDTADPTVGGAGGGGGYASAVFTFAPGAQFIAVVGGGGRRNNNLPHGHGGDGGEPSGGAGGNSDNANGPNGGDGIWGGGGGAGDDVDSVGGSSTYGGGGGAEEDSIGGGSVYGGAGSGGISSPACGISQFGGPCNGEAGWRWWLFHRSFSKQWKRRARQCRRSGRRWPCSNGRTRQGWKRRRQRQHTKRRKR